MDSLASYPDYTKSKNDGTIDGIILEEANAIGNATLFTVGLPSQPGTSQTGGQYFLARCGAQTLLERDENWQIYLRRPLYVCDLQRQPNLSEDENEPTAFDRWALLAPHDDDPGIRWLRTLRPGETINLIGPLGNGFALAPSCRNLLILAEATWLQTLLPVINQMLDTNGRVTAIIQHDGQSDMAELLSSLPIAVEAHLIGPSDSNRNNATDDSWRQTVTDTVRWADQICAAIPHRQHRTLAEIIRNRRFRLEDNYAQMLVRADLACGYGACLACVVPTANGGVTRACVHGPVIDLARLIE